MRCEECGRRNPPKAKICLHCGAGLVVTSSRSTGELFGKTTISHDADGAMVIRGRGGIAAVMLILVLVGVLLWASKSGKIDAFYKASGAELHYQAVLCDNMGLSSAERDQARAAGMRRDRMEEMAQNTRRGGSSLAPNSRECWTRDFGTVKPDASGLPPRVKVQTYYSQSGRQVGE